jgi:transcriptional regulator with XRE-family HTH domain
MFVKSLIVQKMQSERLSVRRAASAIGISHTTLAAYLKGATIDLPTLTRICNWLNVSPRSAMGFDTDSDVASAVATILETEPDLARIFREAASDVQLGSLPFEDFREIVHYAATRLRMAKDRQKEHQLTHG